MIFRNQWPDIDVLNREIRIMKSLDHPNILKLIDVFEDQRFIYLVMELCSGGELLDRIITLGHLTEALASSLMGQILRAIRYVHAQGVAHRDVKLDNFLIAEVATQLEDSTVKLGDFGLAKYTGQGLKTPVGAVSYAAPEVLSGDYSAACDMWSCGVILYILLSGQQPFYGSTPREVRKQVKLGKFAMDGSIWRGITADAKDLIQNLLVRDPAQRITAAQALKHIWIARLAPNAFVLDGRRVIQNLRAFAAQSRFRRAALAVVATQLSSSEMRQLRQAFTAIDTDNSGTLTLEEVHEALKSMDVDMPSDLERILAAIDVGGKGHLNYSEFLAAAVDHQSFLCEEVCWNAFKYFDRNDDGFISHSELTKLLEHDALQELPEAPSVRKIINEVDVNGDGKVEFDEFMRMMLCAERTIDAS
ncbi:CPK2 [Symbiodinium sp. CCMP2456]|nr:CPK2 [Symbiodinium sp. CCMP2456]